MEKEGLPQDAPTSPTSDRSSRYQTRSATTPTKRNASSLTPTSPKATTTTITSPISTPSKTSPLSTPSKKGRGRPSKASSANSTPNKTPSSAKGKSKGDTPSKRAKTKKEEANATSAMQPLITAALERKLAIETMKKTSFYQWCRLYIKNNLTTPDVLMEDVNSINLPPSNTKEILHKWFATSSVKIPTAKEIMRQAMDDAEKWKKENMCRSSNSTVISTTSSSSTSSTTSSTSTTTSQLSTPSISPSNYIIDSREFPTEVLLSQHVEYWKYIKQRWIVHNGMREIHYKKRINQLLQKHMPPSSPSSKLIASPATVSKVILSSPSNTATVHV